MELLRYFGLVLRTAFSHSLTLAQDILFGCVLLVGAAIWVAPKFNMSLDLAPWAFALNGWTVAAIIFGSIVGIRLLLAPYWIWMEQEATIKKHAEQMNAAQAKLDEKRCALSIGPPQRIYDYGNDRWRVKVINSGPAVAVGVQMKLIDIIPSPKENPEAKDSCPHKVVVAGLTFDAPAPTIPAGQSEIFEPFIVHSGGMSITPISNIYTEHGRQIKIDIGEQWSLEYQVFAENSNAVPFAIRMHRREDGAVTVEGIQ